MSQRDELARASKSLAELVFQYPLVFVHPATPFAALLAAILSMNEAIPSCYYVLQNGDEDLGLFLAHLQSAIQELSSFHTESLNPWSLRSEELEAELPRLAELIAQDLARLSEKPYLLILDQIDRLNAADAVQPFLDLLLTLLPGHVHLVVAGRAYPRLPWLALLANAQAAVFANNTIQSEPLLGYESRNRTDMVIQALGAVSVSYKSRPITHWDGYLPRQLFFYILLQGQVSRAQICKTLWPELELEAAVNVFHVTKRRLNKIIGMDCLLYQGDVYILHPDLRFSLDLLPFLKYVIQARQLSPRAAQASWEEAVKLYQGSLLQGMDVPWLRSYRMAFQRAYLEALSALARQAQNRTQQDVYLEHYRALLSEQPFDSDTANRFKQLLLDLKRPEDAKA